MDIDIETYHLKKIIKTLKGYRGNGTSLITLLIPPTDQISKITKLLTEEYHSASNVKSRVNRQSICDALTSVQQKLKLYRAVPDNGLAIFCGYVDEKIVNVCFEPYKQIQCSIYQCDHVFHTDVLDSMCQTNDTFGFIVVDGNGCLFGTLCGNVKLVVKKIDVYLSSKTRRGGQSALRYARLRDEQHYNFLKKVSETCNILFMNGDAPNIKGIIIAGCAAFKDNLVQSNLLDPRLMRVVLKVIVVSYGNERGFEEAINASRDVLSNVKLFKEISVLTDLFDHLGRDTGLVVYGTDDTIKCFHNGMISKLIVYENHDLLDTIIETYHTHGCDLCIVGDRSSEGSMFVKTFQGIGGILRYKLDDVLSEDNDTTNDVSETIV